MGDGDLRLFFLSVFYQISSLTASDWPRFFKIGFNRQVEEGIMGNWSMRRRMMEPLWMTANQEPTVSPTNRRISAWCAAGRQEKPRRHSPALRRLGVRDEIYRLLGKLILRQLPVEVFQIRSSYSPAEVIHVPLSPIIDADAGLVAQIAPV